MARVGFFLTMESGEIRRRSATLELEHQELTPKIRSPTLIIHGLQDSLVSPAPWFSDGCHGFATGDGFCVSKVDGYKLFQYLESTTIIVLF